MTKDAGQESRRGKKMDKVLSQKHLTDTNGEALCGARGPTEKGQAHWGGTGPTAKRCRECIHWVPAEGLKMYSVKGMLAKGWCREYARLSNTKAPGPKFKHSALTCRHFDENPEPPKAFARPDPEGAGWI